MNQTYFIYAFILLALSISLFQVRAERLAGAAYTNSWVRNTYGLPADHIPHTIDTICVTPSGKVAMITEWEEGDANAVLYSPTGSKFGVSLLNDGRN